MDLKKHGFWVALGALAAIAAGLYVFLVWLGIDARIEQRKRELDSAVKNLRKFASIPTEKVADPAEGLPVPSVVDYWQAKRAALEKEAARIEDAYRARDRAFERLFGADRSGEVGLADFVAKLRDSIEKDLEKPYASLFEEPFEKVCPVGQPVPQREEEMPFAQKKFYIAQALLKAAKEAGTKTVVGITFRDAPADADAEKEKKERAPAEVKRIEVNATLRMRAVGIATIVSHLLRSEVVFEVREIGVTGAPFSYPELEPWQIFAVAGAPRPLGIAGGAQAGAAGPWMSFPGDVFIGVQDATDPRAKNPPPEIEEPPVQVKLVLDALDFVLPEKPKG